MVARQFMAERVPKLHRVGINKVVLTSLLGMNMPVFEIGGFYVVKTSILTSTDRILFSIFVNAKDGSIVGFED